MDTNACGLCRYSMSLKNFLLILCFLILPLSVEAKEISSPCENESELCSSLRGVIKDKPNQVSLKFERVVDGDTFVAGGRMIRVWGIDAPEKGYPAYKVSSWLLQSLVDSEILNCRLIDTDKYKRDVMQCRAGDLDVGATMVKFGMAKDYRKYSGGYYKSEQEEAKANKRGIWDTSIDKAMLQQNRNVTD